MSEQALPPRKETERLKYLYARCIGQLYTIGYPVSLSNLQDQDTGMFLRYPLYPWQETDLWAEDEYRIPIKTMQFIGIPTHVNSKKLVWKNEIDLHRFGYLNDHVMKSSGNDIRKTFLFCLLFSIASYVTVPYRSLLLWTMLSNFTFYLSNNIILSFSGVILPGACYVELALEAAIKKTKPEPAIVKNLKFSNILPLHDHLVRTVECTKKAQNEDDWFKFKIVHVTEQGNVVLSSAFLGSFESKDSETALTLSDASKFS